MVGWEAYHTLRSKGSEPGFPDWTLMRERVIFLELKRESGKPSPAQKFWILGLLKAGAEVYIARPSDLATLSTILTMRLPATWTPQAEPIGSALARAARQDPRRG